MSATPLVQRPLARLATEINEAHREVRRHARGMLVEARRAGDALLAAKADADRDIPFKDWVRQNCDFSYSTAAVYMRVAREWQDGSSMLDHHGSLRDFINNKPKRSVEAMTREDAEYILKINALAERGHAGEAEAARIKLDKVARTFGLSTAAAVRRAGELLAPPQAASELDEAITRFIRPFSAVTKPQLLDLLVMCCARHPDLVGLLERQRRSLIGGAAPGDTAREAAPQRKTGNR
ncbi:hypothetical protein [Caenispirillum salinarum]|uniref:hypothetical protein n=1 Tax=Caenispirillum salinarum TaxID=859058 RepID=UPI003850BCC5